MPMNQRLQCWNQTYLKITCQAIRRLQLDRIWKYLRLCDLNTRDGSAKEAFNSVTPALFQEFTKAVQENCPFIHEVIEALVVSNLHKRNVYKTNSHKMLCGLQSLAFMVNIRNLKAGNSFPLLFGLLCISYGSGKQLIDMLQSMGLSLHWNTMWVDVKSVLTTYIKNVEL